MKAYDAARGYLALHNLPAGALVLKCIDFERRIDDGCDNVNGGEILELSPKLPLKIGAERENEKISACWH